MSNTIKLKRGSGSDPSASDLSIGEIAIRTDSGKLFTKKDNGSVAEISGSGGIDDGDKGDITVSNGGDIFTIDSGVVTSAKIADGAIVNADINASAAIAGTKISPDFGSQTITTTGNITTTGDLTVGGTYPAINLYDSNNNPDWRIQNNDGMFAIFDQTNGANRVQINSDGHIDLLANVDISNGLDVTGNITVTGTATISGDNLTVEGTAPFLRLNDTNNDSDFRIYNSNGAFQIYDEDSSGGVVRFSIATNGTANVAGNLDVGAGLDVTGLATVTKTTSSQTESILEVKHGNLSQGIGFGYNTISAIGSSTNVDLRLESKGSGKIYLIDNVNAQAGIDVTGNISVSGTVDGIDISDFHAQAQSFFNNNNSGVLTNGVTATTQSAGDNSTKVATTAYADTAVSNLVDSAPSALNTLNELAAALGDDANFSTTVTNSIATKLPLAGGTLTGDLIITTTNPKIYLNDSSDNPDYFINNNNGYFRINDSTNSVDRFVINTDGHVDIAGNVDFGAGIDVTGAITGTGDLTIDTNTLHVDSTNNRVGIGTASPTVALEITRNAQSGIKITDTAVTNASFEIRPQTGNSTKLFRIIDSTASADRLTINASGTVNVAGSITVGGTVDGRDLATDGTKLDGIEASATADQTASEIVALVANQTIAPSTIDMEDNEKILLGNSDDLEIYHSGSHSIINNNTGDLRIESNRLELLNHDSNEFYLTADDNGEVALYCDGTKRIETNSSGIDVTGDITCTSDLTLDSTNTDHPRITLHSNATGIKKYAILNGQAWNPDAFMVYDIDADQTRLTVEPSGLGINRGANSLSHCLDVGGTAIIRGATEIQGNISLSGDATTTNQDRTISFTGFDKESTSDFTDNAFIRHTTNTGGHSGSVLLISSQNDSNDGIAFATNSSSYLKRNSNIIWDAGNDGSGSGLDADLLDGQEGSYYRNASNINAGTIAAARLPNHSAALLTSGTLPTARLGTLPQRIGLNTTVSNTPASRAAFLALGDGDTGIAQNGDGQLELWANNQEIMNLDTGEIESYKTFRPSSDSSFDLGTSSSRWANVYADTLYGAGSNITALNASNISSGTIAAARLPQQESGTSIVGNFGQWQGHSTYTNFNTVPAYWGWNFVQGNTNAPNTTSSQWYRCRLSLGSEYGFGSDSGDYSLEMALPRSSHSAAGVLHIRTIENGSEGSWTTVGDNASLITTGTISDARLPNSISSSITGNAATATKLATARTIAGVSFDGSANISLNNNAITNGAGYITSADGGNAATLDSLDSTAFLRSNAADTASGDITFSGGEGAATIGGGSDIRFTNGNWTGSGVKIQQHNSYLYIGIGTSGLIFREAGTDRAVLDGDGHFRPATDSNYDLGLSGTRWRNLYADTLYGDGSNLTGISAGATGGGSDEVFYENDQTVTTNYTITNGKNAMAAGPITINSGVTVTVGSGETLTIV